MVTIEIYKGKVQNGEIQLEDVDRLPEGAQVVVTVVVSEQNGEEIQERGITGAEILASGLVGMWSDRDDIEDSAEFADKLRRKWERRE